MTKVVLRKVAVRRFAVTLGLIQAFIGLLYGIILFTTNVLIPSVLLSSATIQFPIWQLIPVFLPFGLVLNVLTYVGLEQFITASLSLPLFPAIWIGVMPLWGFLLGMIQGALLVSAYNLIARITGGLVLQMHFSFLEERRTPPTKASERNV
jgi:hypothetical protein